MRHVLFALHETVTKENAREGVNYLVNEELTVGHFKTKEDSMVTALREFINRRKQLEMVDLLGQFDPDPDYDYKQGR